MTKCIPFLLIVVRYRIFQIPKLGTKLKQDSIPLSYTPRKFITHPGNHYFYLIEGDHRVMGEDAASKKLDDLVRITFFIGSLQLILSFNSVDKGKPSMTKSLTYLQTYLGGLKRQQGHGRLVSASSIL